MVNVKVQVQEKGTVNAFVTEATTEKLVTNVHQAITYLIRMKINYYALLVMLLAMVLAKVQDLKLARCVHMDGT